MSNQATRRRVLLVVGSIITAFAAGAVAEDGHVTPPEAFLHPDGAVRR